MSNRKLKILSISQECLVSLLLDWRRGSRICLPFLEDIPYDVKVEGVYYDHYCGTFKVVIRHDSFPDTCEGAMLPEASSGLMHVVRFTALEDAILKPIIGKDSSYAIVDNKAYQKTEDKK